MSRNLIESDKEGGFYDSDEYYESDRGEVQEKKEKKVMRKKIKKREVKKEVKRVEKKEIDNLKSSIIKKLVCCVGVQRIKPDSIGYIQSIGDRYVKRVIGKIMEEHSDSKRKSIEIGEVLKVLKLSEEDVERMPKEMCQTYYSNDKEKDDNSKIEYYRKQMGRCLFIPKSNFKKMVKENLVGCDVKISKEIYDILQASLESYIIDYIKKASVLAKHRNSKTLERRDFETVKSVYKKI